MLSEETKIGLIVVVTVGLLLGYLTKRNFDENAAQDAAVIELVKAGISPVHARCAVEPFQNQVCMAIALKEKAGAP